MKQNTRRKNANKESMLLTHRVILCIGPGGVGKTTSAASLALSASLLGRKTLVCTLDPAHRLSSALGLETLPHTPTHLPQKNLKAAGLPEDLPLYSMQLDVEAAFEGSLKTYKLSTKAHKKLSNNGLYKKILKDIDGVQTYAAVAQMLELLREGQWDTLVLDTPPTRHVQALLKAPQLLIGAVQSPVFRWLLAPAILSQKVGFKLGRQRVLRKMASIVGIEFLEEVASFISLLGGIVDSLVEDAQKAESFLLSQSLAYLIVTLPTLSRINESLILANQLQSKNMNFAGFLVNRFHPIFPVEPQVMERKNLSQSLEKLLPSKPGAQAEDMKKVTDALLESHASYEQLVEGEMKALQKLRQHLPPGAPLLTVPLLDHDMGNLCDLAEISQRLSKQLFKEITRESN